MKKKILLVSLASAGLLAAGIGGAVYNNQTTLNVKADAMSVTGTATEAVTGKVTLESFQLEQAAGVRLVLPTGIRFQTQISAQDLSELPNNAVFGTLIIPTEVLGENTLDLNNKDALNIVASKWKNDSTENLKLYSGVLVGTEANDFPPEYYDKQLTAISYVTYTDSENELYTIYTSTCERSCSYVAAAELKSGGEDPDNVLKTMADKAVSELLFADMETPLMVGDTAIAELSGNNGLPVIYSVDNDNITINENAITANKVGKSVITATVGTKTATLEVNVLSPTVLDGVVDVQSSSLATGMSLPTAEIGDVVKVKDEEAEYQFTKGTDSISVTLTDTTVRGESFVYVYTANNVYQYNIYVADTFITTADEWKAWIASESKSGYTALSTDLNLDAATVTAPTKLISFDGVLDGRGHSVTNFTTQILFDARIVGATVKNIALSFEKNIWAQQYNSIIACCDMKSSKFENVFMNIIVNKSDTEVQGLLGTRTADNTFNNVVINLQTSGTGKDVFADYSGVGYNATGTQYNASAMNYYVIYNEGVSCHEGNEAAIKATYVTSAKEITQIGGSFEITEGGDVKFNGKTVLVAEKILEKVELTTALQSGKEFSTTASDLGISGTIESAYLKENPALVLTVSGNTISGTLNYGEYTLIVQTGEVEYSVKLYVGDVIISTEEEFANYIKNIPDNKYAILVSDLDMKGQDLTSTKTSSLNASTLDGCGHIVKNFTTSALLTTTGVVGNGACIRNIGLDFTFTAVRNGGIYVTTDMAWCSPGTGYDYTTENVWMNVKLTGTAYNTTIFGQRIRGNVYKNVVINIELVEGTTQTGSLYADYNTTNAMSDSTLTNVYVIDKGNICQQHNNYGWEGLTKVTTVSGVTTIGGLFEQKADGLYFNGTKVLGV